VIPHLDIPISSSGDIALARQAALQVASDHHLHDGDHGRIAVIATEIATCLVNTNTASRMLIGCHAADEGAQVEILGLDSTPGSPDLHRQMRDQERSAAEASGLVLVRRLSSDFAVFSHRDQGNIILARAWSPSNKVRASASPFARFSHAGISLTSPGESLSSNAWRIFIGHGTADVVVADAAHCLGTKGAEAAAVVTHTFQSSRCWPSDRLMHAHANMRDTCGASVAAMSADSASGNVVFAGVGDLSARIVSIETDRVLASIPGRLGRDPVTPINQTYDWPRDSIIVLHSAGLKAGWSFEGTESLLKCDPAVIAAWLLRDFRDRHDVVVVVLKRG
jgi:anti-sigma regulatory factor (Ser/Thr protein kinase)